MRLMKINILIWLIWCNKNWDKLKENIFLHSFEILKFKANIFSVYYIPRELHNVFTFLTDTIYFIFFISCHCHFIAVRKKIISVSYSLFIFFWHYLFECVVLDCELPPPITKYWQNYLQYKTEYLIHFLFQHLWNVCWPFACSRAHYYTLHKYW